MEVDMVGIDVIEIVVNDLSFNRWEIDEEHGVDYGWLIERDIGRLTEIDQLMMEYVLEEIHI